jgi:hypothetical protein
MAEDLAQATPQPAVAPDATPEPIPADDSSLSEHEAAFGPIDPGLSDEAREKAEAKQQRIRHRAKSQQAGPGDVGRIGELTRKLREAEAERDTWKSKASTAPQVQPPAREERPQSTSVQPAPGAGESGSPRQAAAQQNYTRAKPVEDEVGAKYPTYAEFVEDLAEWKVEQREAAREAKQAEERQKAQFEQTQRQWHDTHKTYYERAASFEQQHPDFTTTVNQHINGSTLPPAAYHAIIQHDNGPAIVYHLAQHPDQLTEMQLLFDGKPPSETYVALATQWLSSRTQAAGTGSAASTPPVVLAARPPNPVRAGATQTSDELPGDESSLAQHEHAFGKPRRRAY